MHAHRPPRPVRLPDPPPPSPLANPLLPPSLTHSLTRSLTHSLTHSLSLSLPHSFPQYVFSPSLTRPRRRRISPILGTSAPSAPASHLQVCILSKAYSAAVPMLEQPLLQAAPSPLLPPLLSCRLSSPAASPLPLLPPLLACPPPVPARPLLPAPLAPKPPRAVVRHMNVWPVSLGCRWTRPPRSSRRATCSSTTTTAGLSTSPSSSSNR